MQFQAFTTQAFGESQDWDLIDTTKPAKLFVDGGPDGPIEAEPLVLPAAVLVGLFFGISSCTPEDDETVLLGFSHVEDFGPVLESDAEGAKEVREWLSGFGPCEWLRFTFSRK